ncbi:MAG: hypothetical protein KJ871_01445 [Alphaproteobacteria bacterium]|nr:hypothetical protein [Alphaproteobacteria bacterium]MBU2144067.1 hypothetical protein [Alphaproteobacteria bacterium]MBU2198182.1 hypothetical protein [Alphaproteobacteria bacterium]
MLRNVLLGAAALCLTACANHQPTKTAAMGLPGFMSQADTLEMQRPVLPVTHYVKWYAEDRLQYSIQLDYISGMSQRDYLFEEPNQEMFLPMVRQALYQTGLGAKSGAGARYALQIEFLDLDADAFGRNFAGKTNAIYRLVDRRTNETVYENTIGSRFVAKYPGLNEDDASFAYDVSAAGVIAATRAFGAFSLYEGGLVELWNNNQKLQNFFGGDSIDEVSQAGWNDAYQSYAWVTGISALSGPALVLLGQVNPLNYVSLQLEPRSESADFTKARRRSLSETGIGSRSARERANELNSHLLAQSLTVFLLDLAEKEDVRLTQLVPCGSSPSDASDIIEAVRQRARVVSDDCRLYAAPDTSMGVGITAYK